MSDNVFIGAPSLSGFLDRLGLPPASRDRVIAIDRELAEKVEGGDPDECAELILEAVDLLADVNPAGFEWSGWDDDDDPGDPGDFDLDGMERGEE
ncbi:hypothetical protein NOF55_16465 [Rhizobiaceae bacterium BDR2-2]|uniref:Uncharacterized protein n=1 Tax=Ectorhizobium quercum TaxID=2965071 RepID=A0AAE3MWH7_9HYPH|nr:hypothetical protein [Ectorhizobium quercum]MCX8996253.1 hypothetical protein [Ectorhizobium quercum]MCX8998708.1 hypothetical protein [Ectorhizobium quercum]